MSADAARPPQTSGPEAAPAPASDPVQDAAPRSLPGLITLGGDAGATCGPDDYCR